MFRLDADKPVHFCDGLTRRDFLHAGSLGLLGLTLPDLFTLRALGAVNPDKDVNCILLMLVGAPSQLDTWDMKPDAPAEIRGPYKPIPTNVPGIQISEIFPRMARHADKYALVRSVYHNRPRYRPPDDADWLAVPGWHRVSKHRMRVVEVEGSERRRTSARADASSHREHRRQHAPRPDGRIPGEDLRPLRPQL